MIQINDKTIENVVNFPKNQNLEGDLILKLHSELTQKTYTFNVVDEGSSKRFYKFTLDFSNLEDGEYDYNINEVETGLIRIGVIAEDVKKYENDDVSIVQYYPDSNTNYRLQTKEVTYTDNGQYTVTADPEYYGLKKVNIEVNVPISGYTQEDIDNAYASGWSAGYESGYTDGYNDKRYEKEYLTLNVISAGTVNLNGSNSNFEYNINESGWTTLSGKTEINVQVGDTIKFKGTNGGSRILWRSVDNNCKYELYGNIMSLVAGDNFSASTALFEDAFEYFASENYSLVNVENLILPTFTESRCYQYMFSEVPNIEISPVLPAINLKFGCYVYMFKNCSKLKYVKCLGENYSEYQHQIDGWLQGVSETGTFVKKAGVEWPIGSSGIPNGWTVEEE